MGEGVLNLSHRLSMNNDSKNNYYIFFYLLLPWFFFLLLEAHELLSVELKFIIGTLYKNYRIIELIPHTKKSRKFIS